MTNNSLQFNYKYITIKSAQKEGISIYARTCFSAPKKEISERDRTVISMRLPKDMLANIDKAAKVSGRTRNEIMSLDLESALNHMEIISSGKEKNQIMSKLE